MDKMRLIEIVMGIHDVLPAFRRLPADGIIGIAETDDPAVHLGADTDLFVKMPFHRGFGHTCLPAKLLYGHVAFCLTDQRAGICQCGLARLQAVVGMAQLLQHPGFQYPDNILRLPGLLRQPGKGVPDAPCQDIVEIHHAGIGKFMLWNMQEGPGAKRPEDDVDEGKSAAGLYRTVPGDLPGEVQAGRYQALPIRVARHVQ